jgi:flagellar hook protein FlgE
MFTAFSTALSGMAANTAAIDIISNNLANLNTTGYKATDAQFQDLMSQSLGLGGSSTQIGMGVGMVNTVRQFTQGSVQASTGPTDAAIQGNGFFVVKDSNNQSLFTRAGNFTLDANGTLITAGGDKVQGWVATGGVVNSTGAPGNLTLPVGGTIPATATTKMSMNVNLDPRVATTDPGAVVTAPVQVVDSLGSSHVLTATYTKTGANTWSYAISAPASDLGTAGKITGGAGTLTFNGSGQLIDPPPTKGSVSVQVTGLADQATDMSINWNLYDTSGNAAVTQFAQASGVSGTTQDGATAGQIVKIGLENGGLLVASYSNGQHMTVAQLAVASIRNPESLIAVGNNNLQASSATAAAAIGAADTGGRGKIIGGSLEASTADIATEFTHLISAQRSYQANSKIITTSDQLLQDTVNLIR